MAAAASLAACGKHGGKADGAAAASARPALTVTAQTVESQILPRKVEASGSVAAWQEVPVGAETGGLTAMAVNVDEGDYVKEGQVLVKLDDRLLQAQLRQQQAAVQSAQALKVRDDAALARAQELVKRGFLARASLDTAVANQGTSAAQVATAEAALAETKTRLEQTNVRAPVSGRITARTVVKGQIVTMGAELYRLVRESQLEMNAQIPEADLPYVKAGMSARVEGEQGVSTTGKVRLVTPMVDAQTRLGLARITLPQTSGFRPGNFARASIDIGEQPAAVVPQQAIVYRDGKPGLYVLDGASRARFSAVTTGARTGGLVEIKTGVTAGQRVAVQGAGFLGEGDHVAVAPGAPIRVSDKR